MTCRATTKHASYLCQPRRAGRPWKASRPGSFLRRSSIKSASTRARVDGPRHKAVGRSNCSSGQRSGAPSRLAPLPPQLGPLRHDAHSFRGALSAHPEWEDLLDAFRVEGACILGDWDEVEARTQRSQAKSAQHSIGRALLAMRQSDADMFGNVLVQARQDLGKPLVAAGTASYPSVYDSVLHLHMLQELEMIRSHAGRHSGSRAVTRANFSDTVSDLNKTLTARLNATLPSFRTQEPAA
ncbi:hypothetical protein L1887_48574 [Cichorium endivia]|nr:hypothetical protein L1887_48574 [Cichorium endivia]